MYIVCYRKTYSSTPTICWKFSRAFGIHPDPFVSDGVCCYSQPRFDEHCLLFVCFVFVLFLRTLGSNVLCFVIDVDIIYLNSLKPKHKRVKQFMQTSTVKWHNRELPVRLFECLLHLYSLSLIHTAPNEFSTGWKSWPYSSFTRKSLVLNSALFTRNWWIRLNLNHLPMRRELLQQSKMASLSWVTTHPCNSAFAVQKFRPRQSTVPANILPRL